jgi:alkylation response protein AidB-like acyl-CoA dehydrogenase
MYAVNALGSFPIILEGTEDQKNRFLPGIAKGEKLIAFGLSEKMAGSDASSLTTKATEDGDDYIVEGEKKWTTNGGAADYYTVFAVTDPESKKRRVSALIVEKGMDGFSIGKVEDKMGIRCVPVVETIYDKVRVPSENLLGGEPGLGFKQAMVALDLARPAVAAQAIGLAQGALDLALAYTHRRKQFGQSVASFQMVQGMLADMSSKTSAARQLVYAAAKAASEKHPDLSLYSAQCKLFASDVAMQVTTDAVQLFGGYGYMRDYPVEKFMRDAKITQIYEGTNQIQRLVIARNLTKYVERELGFLDNFIRRE